jgi:hypothetical protein
MGQGSESTRHDTPIGTAVRAGQRPGREWTLHRWCQETTDRQSKPGDVGFAVFCCRSATGLLCPLWVGYGHRPNRPGPKLALMRTTATKSRDVVHMHATTNERTL